MKITVTKTNNNINRSNNNINKMLKVIYVATNNEKKNNNNFYLLRSNNNMNKIYMVYIYIYKYIHNLCSNTLLSSS